MYAQVIVDIVHSNVDRIYDYACDENLKIGSRVKVPFGGRVVDGFVVGISSTSSYSPDKVKSVTKVFDEQPALVEECVQLMETIAKRYRVPKAAALRLFLPSEMRLGKVREAYKKYVKLVADVPLSKAAKKQQELIEYLKTVPECEMNTLLKGFPHSAISALSQKGAICIESRKINRAPTIEEGTSAFHTLSPDQQNAIESINSTDRTVTLIHGVTGSGKTEIYMNIIAQQLKLGKTAIFLVPEISLTPQMLGQLRARFKGEVAILHSGLTEGERFDEWWRIRSGEAKIAIGARSAIFVPLENLGAIIIDEEHDNSYISEHAPRYNTIEVAKMRAEYNGCKLILGSATPSVESFVEANEGRYNLVTLTERINHKPMPEIIIADMRQEVKRGNNTAFSAALREELDKTLGSGNQAIVFLNRRGFSQTVVCRDCGYVAKCINCDVSLTYHREDNCLKCHYCGTKYNMLPACPECGGKHILYNGIGTQRVVADLKELFPQARILRMDNDTVSGKDGHYKILHKFAQREADILVGTQMIAKGHDFPSVTLVGILDADMSLHFSDYRSGERTFQLITQVAGRSGRADEKGKVVLQTYSPEDYILRYATSYDYLGFFNNEVEVRKATYFPPFAIICRVMVVSENNDRALEVLRNVYFEVEALRKEDGDEFVFLNKTHSPIKRANNKMRYQVLMRLKSGKFLESIYEIADRNQAADTMVYVEENPINLT